ncbi:MAG: homoserine kinase [bacterium]
MISEIKIFAPATVANVGCGFDILGFALQHPGDYVTVRKIHGSEVRIKKITGDEGKLPRDPDKNTAGVAAMEFLKKFNIKSGVELEIQKGMPMGSGLGSSAASSAATLFGLKHIFLHNTDRKQLLSCGLQAEAAACGYPHADNIAPSLLGGLVLIRSYDPLEVIPLSFPEDLFCTVICPHIELKTRKLRELLPEKVLLSSAVKQWGNVAGLIIGLEKKDYVLISRSMEDYIIEPVRSAFIPFFQKIKSCALASGALGCSISGSGPSVFALSQGKDTAEMVSTSMADIYEKHSISYKIYNSSINREGPRLC